jgi:hypothetical protein
MRCQLLRQFDPQCGATAGDKREVLLLALAAHSAAVGTHDVQAMNG